jgi:adenylate kinase family enzyme
MKMKSSYQFSDKDMDIAWPLYMKWNNDEALTRAEEDFMNLAFEADRFKCERKTWPTVGQVLEYIEQQKQKAIDHTKRLAEICKRKN